VKRYCRLGNQARFPLGRYIVRLRQTGTKTRLL
jgi:hypothetical protein